MELWADKFGAVGDPAGDPNATNATFDTTAFSRTPTRDVFARAWDTAKPYSIGNTRSIIVELNDHVEGSNLGAQTLTDLGLAGASIVNGAVTEGTDVRDGIASGADVDARNTKVNERVENTVSTPAVGPGDIKVVRGQYRTSNASALIDFQNKTAAMASDPTEMTAQVGWV
jgi:hypothetical protein